MTPFFIVDLTKTQRCSNYAGNERRGSTQDSNYLPKSQ